jgi:hypothetical protein
MQKDNEGVLFGPVVQFAEGTSEEEVRHIMASLMALNGCFNTLMEKIEETATAQLPPEETEWHQEAKEIEALRLVIEFLRVCDPPAEGIVTGLLRPLLGRLVDDLARKRSIRPGGGRPPEYVLTGSIWRADCAAAADVLICSRPKMTHKCAKAWLRPRLVRYGLSHHATAEQVIEWRDEIVRRLPQFRRLDKTAGQKKPLDMMAEIFAQCRPLGPEKKRERVSQAEAERLADEWLQDARLNLP